MQEFFSFPIPDADSELPRPPFFLDESEGVFLTVVHGKQPSCRFQQDGRQPQQSLCDPPHPPQAQKHGSGFRDLITWQPAPMIGRILAEFGFYLRIPQEFWLYMVMSLWKNMQLRELGGV